MKITDILGVNIHNFTKNEVLQKINSFLTDGRQHWIATINPEIILRARKDEEYRRILGEADLRVADGIGVSLASWWLGQGFLERIAGVDLVYDISQDAERRGKTRGTLRKENINGGGLTPLTRVMIIGAGKDSRQKAQENLRKLFLDINLEISLVDIDISSKSQELFFKLNEEIKNFYPQVLFVAFGAPRQEEWIYENLKLFPTVKLAIGVGGAVDMISGKFPRAPHWMRKIGLEWLWRLWLEPARWKRILNAVFIFPWLVVTSNLKSKI